ncbi:Protein of unknown function [Cotesia congregata]|uniref:Uncharacterized protein n=1 Tax=Cotesia congregata TaxID=51543 RepID=A0A8J2H930_COTCN|nr:Protein of unknown function [Cotesia congregata]
MTSSPRRNNQRSSPSPCQQQQHSPIEPQSQPQAQSQQHQTHQQVSSHLQNRSPLSRLAIHTQGAPLILAGRFHNRGKPVNSNNVIAAPNVNNFCNVNINSNGNTIDESSNNCENSLPRIIKPRKRRKKDRKPTNVVTTENSKPEDRDRDRDLSVSMNPGLMPSGMNGDQSNLVTLKPYVPVCYEAMRYELPQQQQQGTVQHRAHRRPPVTRESYSGRTQTLIQQEIVDTRQSSLIWDVDQNGYSPFLTPPPTSNGSNNEFVQFSQIPLFLSRANLGGGCHQEPSEFFDVEDSLRGPHHHQHQHQHQHHQHHHQHLPVPVGAARVGHERLEPPGGALLRRSWSDPSSYFSEQICAPSRDVGVIGDRGQTAEALARGRSSWPGSPSYVSLGTNASGLSGSLPGNSVTGQSLEVSTEIVTSHNGHRDLEIKFFSSSPSSIQPEEEKSPFPEDNEDFSDIWSYHESKLQQDFRTLLQAEE